ncbi:DnaJ (Hsp40), sub C, member 2 [Perkinsus olseni]|uniref:DnaJ (Hsp40), sub C, member 2 n=1 Tax=Perkinsus olseni TaxID=32597 RepID=A0A7J6LHN3_PEROL|nr:DnaJ (Hsp40), sub C, member 2 [Perkinsus olseni]
MAPAHLPSILLALPPVPEGFQDEVVGTIDLRTRRVEPAGRSFHRVWEKPRLSRSERKKAHKGGSETPESSAESTSEEPSSRSGWSAKRKAKKPVGEQLKLNKVLEGLNLYDILKVSPTATQDQIKKSYRRLVLEHHPDKKKGSAEEEEEKLIFLRIQEAFEVLSDERRRKQYDSSLPFDETIPTELEEGEDFYEVFGPVFDSNARWSNRRPVPRLGDDSTDLNKVKRFYHFWMNFDSWRDFSQHDEYDVADASCREERRWVERQNQRIRRKYETAEASRVRKLVESAMQLDPRLLREKEDERRVKELQQKEKEDKRKQKLEEEEAKRRRKAAEEIEASKRKEEEKQREKEERERLKKIRQTVRNVYKESCDTVDQETLKKLLLELTAPQLEKFATKAESLAQDGGKLKAMFDAALDHVLQAKKKSVKHVASAAKTNKHGKKPRGKVGAPWSLDEVHMLAKGQQKYKVGYAGRWKAIAQFLQAAGFDRTANEVIAQTRLMATPEYLKNQKAEEKQEPASSKLENVAQETASSPPPPPPPSPPPAKVEATSSPEDWTAAQQKALEKGLATHHASLGANERWKRIADDVPGKTKKECVARFKYIRELVSKGRA